MIRWLRWNLVCWRGRRCADLMVDGDSLEANVAHMDPSVVVGTTVRLWFRCGGCGTEYLLEALVTAPDSVVHLDRVRVG